MDEEKWRKRLAGCWPAAFFLLLTIILTWPHARDLDFALPGMENEAVDSDALFNVWTLAQAVRNVTGRGDGLFESNAFWPRRLTLCYSDHLFGWLPFALPLSLLTDNFVLIYNILFLLTFVLSGLGVYLLVKDLTGNPIAAALSGVIFAFCPFRMTQYGHFAGESLQWVPFALFCVHRFLRGQQLRYAVGGIFFVSLQTVTSGIYGVYFCIYLGSLLLIRAVWRKQASKRGLLTLLICGAAVFLILLPFYWPNLVLKQEMGFARTDRENIRVAADVLTIFGVAEHNIYQWAVGGKLPPGEGMFPGLLVLLFAGYGFLQCWKKGGAAREIAFLYLFGAVLSWLLCLGPRVKFNGAPLLPGPYALLMWVCPWIQVLRMSTRFGALMMLSLAILAGLGISQWLENRPKYLWHYAGAILLILVIEYASVPRPLGAAPDAAGVPGVYQWLAQQPDEKVIVEVPYTHGYTDAFWMYYSIRHGKKILNGYSAYTPPEGKIAVMALVDFPSERAIELLDVTGADWVVVHRDVFPRPVPDHIQGLRLLGRFGPDAVYEILKEPGPTPSPELSRVSPERYRLSSGREPERLKRMLNSSGASWPSDGFDEPVAEIRIVFPTPTRVRRVELSFDPLADLSPARFRLRGSEDGDTWQELDVSHLLPAFYCSARKEPRCPVLQLELPEQEYRDLAIMPDLAPGMCSWPITRLVLWEQSRGP